MRARRLAWLGIATPRHREMTRFLRDVLGMQLEFETETTAELAFAAGDRVQVFGPGHRYYDFFRENAAGPVALFEVDDVHEAKAELERAGVELVGHVESDDDWAWLNFRGPDGHLYEVASTSASQ
jgi:catechol 2,3-dioxygenase-like lactoylglutathione lyase family enzyme